MSAAGSWLGDSCADHTFDDFLFGPNIADMRWDMFCGMNLAMADGIGANGSGWLVSGDDSLESVDVPELELLSAPERACGLFSTTLLGVDSREEPLDKLLESDAWSDDSFAGCVESDSARCRRLELICDKFAFGASNEMFGDVSCAAFGSGSREDTVDELPVSDVSPEAFSDDSASDRAFLRRIFLDNFRCVLPRRRTI